MYNARKTRAIAGQRKRRRLPDSSPPWQGYLRGSEVTFQISSHIHDDVIAQGLRTIPCFDLKDPPACGVHRVIIKAIGIPILVQYMFDIYCLFRRHPVRSCIEDFWRKKKKKEGKKIIIECHLTDVLIHFLFSCVTNNSNPFAFKERH